MTSSNRQAKSRFPKLFAALAIFVFSHSPLFAEDGFFDDYLWLDAELGLTVVGTVETTQHIEVITREDIMRRGATDIANLLQETIGVNIVSYGPRGNQTGISLRGFDSRRVAFLINGVPANSALDGRFDIFQIDPATIERIEVIHGGSDSRFNVSGALGGVINIITIAPQEPGMRFGVSMSNSSALPGTHRGRDGQERSPHWEDLLDAQNVALSFGYGSGAFSTTANVFFNRAQNHFLFEDSFGFTRRKDNNEVWDIGASANVLLVLPNMARLISSSHFFYADRNIPTSGWSPDFGSLLDTFGRQSFMLEMPRVFHDTLAVEASLTWSLNNRDFSSHEGAFSRHNQHGLTAINRWSWFPLDNLTVRSGFDYTFTHLDSTEMGVRSRHDGGAYAAVEIAIGQRFLLVPSIKAAVTSGGTTEVAPVPKLGFLWRISDNVTLRNNYFRSFKFPGFEELYWVGGDGFFGNPDLLPQDGWGADLGVEWNPHSRIRLENVFFAQWTENSIHWFETAGIWQPENIGEAAFFGLTNSVRFDIPVSIWQAERVIVTLSHQFLQSYLLSFGFTFASGNRIPYTPQHTFGVTLDIPWQTGSLVISGHFEGSRFHDRANLVELPSHFLLNATYTQRINQNLQAFASLRNILNQSYEAFLAFPMPGISLTLGLRLNIEVNRDE